MISAEQKQRIAAIKWYHAFDFGDGVVTRPPDPYPEVWRHIEGFLDSVEFAGRTVLDVGAWDGYWSFYAERRGAASVLATDQNDQRWAGEAGAAFAPAGEADNEGFRLAHEIYHSRVGYRGDVSVYDLAALGTTFDLVLCLGVYYHLTHLTQALTQLRHAVNTGGEVVVEGGAIDDERRSYMEYYYGRDGDEPYREDVSNWSLPTRRCLHDMLASNYFEIVADSFVGPVGRKRYGRAIVRARAVERADENHVYRPLLGLDAHDPRWREA